MVRPAVKELKKSEAMNKSVVDELVHGAGTKNKKKYIVNITPLYATINDTY